MQEKSAASGGGRGRRPERLPILVSAFVMTGAGQFLQRRWVAGIVLGGSFIWLFADALVRFVRLIMLYYAAWDMSAEPAPGEANRLLHGCLLYLAAAFVVYFIGVLDAFLAYRRRCRTWESMNEHAVVEAAAAGAPVPPPLPTDDKT